jgi:hypothetical protein
MPITVDIPLSQGAPLPYFDMQTLLDGVTYTLQFRWNVRCSAWFLDVLDEAGQTVVMAGLKLVADWPLAAYRTGARLPGALVFVDTSGNGQDPGLTDLGIRVLMLYFSAAELGLTSG